MFPDCSFDRSVGVQKLLQLTGWHRRRGPSGYFRRRDEKVCLRAESLSKVSTAWSPPIAGKGFPMWPRPRFLCSARPDEKQDGPPASECSSCLSAISSVVPHFRRAVVGSRYAFGILLIE
jgi:hypothetical protein